MALPISNRLFDRLPPELRSRLLLHAQAVALPVRTHIFSPGETPRYVHLMTSGIASLVAPMLDGTGVEIGLVGREGIPEALHLLGPGPSVSRCFIQVPGTGVRIDYERFEREFQTSEPLRSLVLRYVQYGTSVMGQIAACNRLHNVEQRLARWLLMVADRLGEDRAQLTHEFLAEMIGSRRTTVTVAATILQGNGLISYHRGDIQILDRERLLAASCGCYAVIRHLLDSLYT